MPRMHCVVTFSVRTPFNDREQKGMTVRDVDSPREAIARVKEVYGAGDPIIYTGYAVIPDDIDRRAFPFDAEGNFFTHGS